MGCCKRERHGNTRVAPEKGEAVDPEYEEDLKGPLKDRGCTDIFCTLLFLANLGGMAYVGYLGWQTGDPFRFIYGMDSFGNTCNRKNSITYDGASLSGMDMTSKPYLYYFNILTFTTPDVVQSTDYTQLCVAKCPDQTITNLQDYYDTAQLCRYDLAKADYPTTLADSKCDGETCPKTSDVIPFDTHEVLLNRCMPTSLISAGTSIFGVASASLSFLESACSEAGDFFSKSASDIAQTYTDIGYMMIISVGVSFVIIILMRFLAAILIWGLVIICALGVLAGCAYCWYRYYTYWDALNDIAAADQTDTEKKTVENWLIYSILASIGAAIILLILLIMRKRIGMVVQLFKEASRAMVDMPFLILQPIWTLLALVTTSVVVGFVFLWIETSGDSTVDSNGKVEISQNETMVYLKWYYLFGMLWCIALVFACHQVVIAGAVASWYFTRVKPKIWWPVLGSIWRLIRYHIGSVAFGSFIIAVIWLCQIILAYIQRKLAGKAGPLVDFMLKCLSVCLWCFEKFMKFINKNAYIMVAIYGYNFCRGAARGFTLVVSNVLRVAAVNSVGAFVILLGKIGVVAIVEVIAFEFFINESSGLCYFWVPLVFVGIGSFVIAHMFIGVYDMVIDTIFMCFLEDSEQNDGIDKPYYMSKGLMEYVENSKKALEAEEQRGKQRAEKKAAREAAFREESMKR